MNNELLNRIKDFIIRYKVINILMAIIAYFSICEQKSLIAYDLNSWLMFFCLVILFVKTKVEKKYKKPIMIYSIVFSLLFVFGKIVYGFQRIKDVNVFKELFHFKYLIFTLGTFSIIFFVLCYLFPFLFKKLKSSRRISDEDLTKNVFLTSFLFIIIAWLPYFVSYYPGLLTQDSFDSLDMALIKGQPLSNHHPMLYTTTIIIFVKLGVKIFGNLSAAIAIDIIFQMIVMAAIFAYCITYFYKLKANKILLTIMLLIYALLPVFGFYSITMWKDIMFSGFILLLTIQSFNIIKLDGENSINLKKLIPFIIISLLCLLFRNNAIYMYILYIIVMLCMYKKHFKTFIVSFLIILSVYFFIQGPVFRYFNVQKTESAEYIAMPLQMVGRMAYKDVKFTKEEKKLINNLIPIDVLPSAYNPATSNGIKFNSKYNAKVFDKNKSKYFKLWLSLVTKHPDVALEAYFNSTLGYWYPGLSFWAAATSTYLGNDYGIKNNAISDSVKNFTLYLENRNTPVFNIQWSIGLYFWFISILIYVAIKKYGSKIITVYIPVIGIWITLMIASPVFGEFRYIFSALTCLPFYIFINYSNNDFSKKIHKQKKK